MYLIGFLLALVIGLIATPWVRRLAVKQGIMDIPGEARRIHSRPVARLGGLAIYAAFVIPLLLLLPASRPLFGLLGGVTILLLVGIVDDSRGLGPWTKLVWQILAACVALAGGIGITAITSPFGGTITLNSWNIPVQLGLLHFNVSPIANTLSIVWMVGVINVINFLDGLDGLACGVSSIAAFVMFLLAVGPKLHQPEVALIAIILAGATLGFLPYNFFPARIFLGDSGSYFLGLTLSLLAIYSGAKLATAGLVLGFTIIDGAWTVLRRLYRRTSPFKADKGHLHHLLLEAGLSQRQAVVGLYLLSLVFGLSALITGSFSKLIILVVLLLTTATLITSLMVVISRKGRTS
ncbi:MAG TPA: MraY family glycosyltransferase [Candidatus Nanoarchaeia archaeon]|nr:MraY family glycosyltransferase [Candidatus Nanoarchaeia archaeon]